MDAGGLQVGRRLTQAASLLSLLPDFDLALDLGFLTKNRQYTFFAVRCRIGSVDADGEGIRARAATLELD